MDEHSFETPGEILLRLGNKHGYPNIVRMAEEFIEREKLISIQEEWIEGEKERQSIQKSQPNHFGRWNHD